MSLDNRKIGILGGGQLGRMLIQAGQLLNLDILVLENDKNSPAKQVTNKNDEHVLGSFNDPAAIKDLASKVDILTIEIEHVNVEILELIQSTNPNIRISPSPSTIKVIQDKYLQKLHLINHGIPVAKSLSVDQSEDALLELIDKEYNGIYPIMLKARRQAYDGKGNYLVRDKSEVKEAVETLSKTAGDGGLYVEELAPFIAEIAVMVVRSASGEVVAYPAVETVHEDSICSVVYAPLQTSDKEVQKVSQEVAKNAVSTFEGAGVFGVEMFLLGDGQILLNEIAPRPHNSGHYTIEACATSQYANHLRAILDLPLGSTDLVVGYAGMINLLGRNNESEEGVLKLSRKALEIPGAHVHLYGKAGCRKGRKMGHITVVGNNAHTVHQHINNLSSLLPPSNSRKSPLPLSHISQLLPSSFKTSDNATSDLKPIVSIIMGSDSDLKVMNAAAEILKQFRIPYEVTIVSAHRTPDRMFEFAKSAASRGVRCIIAGAGGAAHLPGMVASMTPLPVIGVPVKGSSLDGVDSLHSIVQMPVRIIYISKKLENY